MHFKVIPHDGAGYYRVMRHEHSRDTAPKVIALVMLAGDAGTAELYPPAAEAAIYADAIRDALQREFGRAEGRSADDLGTFYGHPIPPALAEVAHHLTAAEGLELTQRTPEQHQAIQRFIAYCDAEGIALPQKPPPDAADAEE